MKGLTLLIGGLPNIDGVTLGGVAIKGGPLSGVHCTGVGPVDQFLHSTLFKETYLLWHRPADFLSIKKTIHQFKNLMQTIRLTQPWR